MKRRIASVVLAAVAAVLYSSFLLTYLTGSGRSADFVSELERPGAPYAAWYRASDVVAGIAMLALAWLCRSLFPGRGVRPAVRWAVVAVTAVGVASMLDGASSMDCVSSVTSRCDLGDHSVVGLLRQLVVGHTLSGLVGFAAAGMGAAWCARAAWSSSNDLWMRVHIVLGAGIGLCGLADLVLLLGQIDVGLVERVRILLVSLWVGALPWTLHAVRSSCLSGASRAELVTSQGAVHS